jgi:hypothetical protein
VLIRPSKRAISGWLDEVIAQFNLNMYLLIKSCDVHVVLTSPTAPS